MLTNEQYKSYVGQYIKRFYQPFATENIFKILDFRIGTQESVHGEEFDYPEFFCRDGDYEWWWDCEDFCIITNETPIKDLECVANVNHKDYVGFNPFTEK